MISQIIKDAVVFDEYRHMKLINICKDFYLTELALQIINLFQN